MRDERRTDGASSEFEVWLEPEGEETLMALRVVVGPAASQAFVHAMYNASEAAANGSLRGM